MLPPDLVEAVREQNAILFVGAGVSQNLGLPGFSRLIGLMGEDLGYDPEVFSMYGDFMTLAEYYEGERHGLSGLRNQLNKEWHRDDIDLGQSDIHRCIVELGFPLIYTTNWDEWIERSFDRLDRKHKRIADVGDLRDLRAGVTQIVKYHGDFQADTFDNLVLTEASYFDRLSFDSPLDIKLRADSLARPILFIGYSLADINIRYLLHRLDRVWKDSGLSGSRPSSYIALFRPNPIQEKVLAKRGVTTLLMDGADQGTALRNFLSELLREARGTELTGTW